MSHRAKRAELQPLGLRPKIGAIHLRQQLQGMLPFQALHSSKEHTGS